MFKQSLALRVLVICFLILALPLLLYTFVFFNRSYEELIDQANKTLEEASLYRTLFLEELAPANLTFLKELDYLLNLQQEIQNLPNQAFNLRLIELTGKIKSIDVFIFDAGSQGKYRVIASDSGRAVDIDFENDNSLNRIAKKGRGIFINYHYSNELRKYIPYLYSVLAIYDPKDHKLEGFLAIRNNILEAHTNFLQPFHENNHWIFFAVIDVHGFIRSATDQNLEGKSFTISSVDKKNSLLITKKNINGNLFEFIWQQERQLAATTAYQETGVSVVAYTSKKEVFEEAMQRFVIIYITLGLTLLIGSGFIYFLTRWMSAPINQLLKLMKKVQKGDLSVRYIPEKLGFELNILGNIFNETVTSLIRNIHSAEKERLKKEMAQKEFEVVKQIQRALLPKKIPNVQEIDISGSFLMLAEPGGNFYDFLVQEDRLFLICADPSGTGLSPCLYALDVRTFFRAYVQMHKEGGELMALVNNAFCDDTGDTGMFVTAMMAVYHRQKRILTYYAAGHAPGLLRKKNGEVIELEKQGIALGLKKADSYKTTSLLLEPGDLLLFYTEGLVKMVNENHELFSNERLKDLLQKNNWIHAKECVEKITSEVVTFIGHAPQNETFVLLALIVS